MDNEQPQIDGPIDPEGFAKSSTASALVVIESDREAHVYSVDVDLRERTFSVTTPDGEPASDTLGEIISSSIKKAMDGDVIDEDLNLFEDSTGPGLMVPEPVRSISSPTGWSTAPHALAAIYKAAKSMSGKRGDTSWDGYGANPGWDGSG